MRGIAFRRILPITQLALAAALIMVGNAQKSAQAAEWEARNPGGWNLRPSRDIPALVEIAIGINAPVLFGVAAVFLVAHRVVGEQTWFFYAASAIGILAFWYVVGTCVDRARGLLPVREQKRPGIATRVFTWIGLFLCPFLAVLVFKTIFEVQGWHGEHDVYNRAGIAAWLMIAAAFLALKLRRWSALAHTASSGNSVP